MKVTNPFSASLRTAVGLLLALYLTAVIDVVTGLNLNLFGYGREPMMFAVGTTLVGSILYALGHRWLGIIGLVFCCAWLVLYPAKNGFDVVLSPLLLVSIAQWLWTLRKLRKRKQ